MKYVKIPNNPVFASAVLVAADAPETVISGLKKLGIGVILGGKIDYAVKAVNCHIDTQILHIGDNVFVVSPLVYQHYRNVLTGAKLLVGESSGQSSYPDDAVYNAANTGRYVIHNFKYTDKTALSVLKEEKIQVSQGYSKCSLCIVNENSVITEDKGIANSLERHNIDVLVISAGDVVLDGLQYGFIGGASGKLSEKILAFAGDITTHRDYERILKFCLDRGVGPISLCGGSLVDVGSIIPIIEKE
ncbi:MAG: DUF6873 family GME fold protein [Monoglobales bacterium]